MEEDMIPATLNLENPNPEINGLNNGNLEIVTANRKWSSDYAAINGIGINNYFGHMIIKRNPKGKIEIQCDIPRIFTLSTRTEGSIQQAFKTVIIKYAELLTRI